MRAALAALAVLVLSGCSSESDAAAPFQVQVNVVADPGEPLPGAQVLLSGQAVGKTDAQGLAKLQLEGAEGESFAFSVKCPEGYQSPKKPVVVTLRRIVGDSKIPRYTAECPPTVRTVVVAVRAVNGPNLPVIYLGRSIATTDQSGAAHIMLRLPPQQSFRLSLDTSAPEASKLRPESPSATFEVKNADDVFVFDQEFKKQEPRRIYRRRRPVGPTPL